MHGTPNYGQRNSRELCPHIYAILTFPKPAWLLKRMPDFVARFLKVNRLLTAISTGAGLRQVFCWDRDRHRGL
jgi:hypothetical protein